MKKYITYSVIVSLGLLSMGKGIDTHALDKKHTKKVTIVDKDHNKIPDDWQRKYHLGYGASVASKDNDKDGLKNLVEYQLKLNPTTKDTDKDKITDGKEDYDKDGVTNLEEEQAKLNPTTQDTDKDGIKDGNEDNDQDDLTTLEEQNLDTNPVKSDTDKDGIADGNEDYDHDGLDNKTEYGTHLNPKMADSDHDGTKDGDEDYDHDGVENKNEVVEFEIRLFDGEGKKLFINYEKEHGKEKIKIIKNERNIANINELVAKIIITPETTKEDLANQMKTIFNIDTISKFSFQAQFGNGKEKEGEFEGKQNDDNNGEDEGEDDGE